MKNIARILIVVLALTQTGFAAFAQTRISGKVIDKTGAGIPGAVVMLEGNTSVGAMTLDDGTYTLTIPSAKNTSLVATCLGYKDQVLKIDGNVINFILEDDSDLLDEVVVVGYGAMRRSDLTGAVASVKIDEQEALRSTSLDQLLQGKAAGVQVLNNDASPDGGISIRIRGISSFNSSNEPLYVVDGVMINSSQGEESLLTKGADNSDSDENVNPLMGLNPSDIESMEVLKDASATAIYGALGANGVVLITTKTADRDRTTVRFSAGVDVSTLAKRQDVLSFDEYVQYLEMMHATGDQEAYSILNQIYSDPATHTGLKVQPVDWQDEVMRTAISQRYNLAISGKPKSMIYSISLGYSDKQGIIKGTGVKQYTMRVNLSKNVGRNFSFGTKTNFAYIDSDLTQSTAGGRLSAATSLTRALSSYKPFKSADEEIVAEQDEEYMSSPDKWINTDHYRNTRREFRITPNLWAEYKILSNLKFKSVLGADYRNSERMKFKSAMINTTTTGSNGASALSEYFNWNWDNTLEYTGKWGGHTLTAMGGVSARSTSSAIQTIEGWNIEQYKAGIAAIANAPNRSMNYVETSQRTLSFFARAVYNYRDRYVLTSTVRADGSSKFMGSNKWAVFPSFAFAWRASKEPWFNVPVISMLKARLGWGRVGNQNITSYQTVNNYTVSHIPTHDPSSSSEYSTAVTPANYANPNLKWETTQQLNAGIDFGMWQGRLALTVDAYDKTTYDLLQTKEIPGSSGFTYYYVNEGTIRNRGLEFTLDCVPVKAGKFEWSLGGNISFNRSNIIKISDTADSKNIWVTPERQENVVYFEGSQIGNSAYCSQTANIFMEGYEMGLFYGYLVKGLTSEGALEYCDLNGNGTIDQDDRTIIGNPNPDFTYGFNTRFSYSNLALTLNFNGSQGNDIFNFNSACETATDIVKHNHTRECVFNCWTPENTDAKYPALGKMTGNDYKKFTSLYVEDGSYLRLSNVTLSYSIPRKNAKVVRGITLSAAVSNAFVWTKYSGWDPDVNSFGTNIKKMGVDSGSYPASRTFSFDVRLTF